MKVCVINEEQLKFIKSMAKAVSDTTTNDVCDSASRSIMSTIDSLIKECKDIPYDIIYKIIEMINNNESSTSILKRVISNQDKLGKKGK